MEKFEALNDMIRTMQTDIRVEVILADLLAAGISLEDVELVSNSLFHRNYHRDIEMASTEEPDATGRRKIRFVLNRQGLYDQLPEDLFHQPAISPGNAHKTTTLQEIREQASTEDRSRRFFLPIEHEFFRQRVRLENEERKFLFEKSDNVAAEIFDLLWELPEFLDEQQKSRLGMLMPLLHSISGNTRLMEAAMESVTGDNVTIRFSKPVEMALEDPARLGKSVLGSDSVLGGRVSSWQRGYQVIVQLPTADSLADWLHEGKKRTLYEFLCTLLMPFDADVTIDPAMPASGSGFVLDDSQSVCARLNFTTKL